VVKKNDFESSKERLIKPLAIELKEEGFKVFRLLHRNEQTTRFKVSTYSILLKVLRNENILDRKQFDELVRTLKVRIETNFIQSINETDRQQ
jgi:mRNA-degrading endonuclease RelE of RelBE toxin-antitoxin system